MHFRHTHYRKYQQLKYLVCYLLTPCANCVSKLLPGPTQYLNTKGEFEEVSAVTFIPSNVLLKRNVSCVARNIRTSLSLLN